MKNEMRPFLDCLLCFIVVLVAMITLLKVTTETTDQSIKSNIVYKVVITWPIGDNDDVDLWMKDPNNHVCGFKRREGGDGSFMSLTHDDVGNNQAEGLEEHMEVINIRGAVEGEYIANCHYFSKNGGSAEVEVTAKLVRMKPFKEEVVKTVKLYSDGDERTFFRFSLDKDANVVDINELPATIAIQK